MPEAEARGHTLTTRSPRTRQGTSKAKTFMEKPSTVLTTFKSYKAEYAKVWLWLDT
ncbi:unnamed protein product [Ectocarpus sp. CCAP 1310/34]|nr:unnamed protein product [Ectocarpus sp. CCAP 1310/34]